MTTVRTLIEDFTDQLTAALESQVVARARQAVESAFGVRRPGRPPKVSPLAVGKKPRKKAPVQLCPVPGCKNPGAPVFGMVCAKHKDMPKAKIKKFREARRAKKLGIKPVRAPQRRTKKDLPKARIKKFRKARKAKKPAIKMVKAKRRTQKAAPPRAVVAAHPPAAAAA